MVLCAAVTPLPTADDAVCAADGGAACTDPRGETSLVGGIFKRSKFDGDENGAPDGLLLGPGGVETGFRLRSLLVGEKGTPLTDAESEDWVLLFGPVVAAVAWGMGLGRA